MQIKNLDLSDREATIQAAEANGWWLVVDMEEIDGIALPASDARQTWEELAPGECFQILEVLTADEAYEREKKAEEARLRRAYCTARKRSTPTNEQERMLKSQRRAGVERMREASETQARFIQRWTNQETAKRLAPHMTMPEVESLIHLLRHLGQVEAMGLWAEEWER